MVVGGRWWLVVVGGGGRWRSRGGKVVGRGFGLQGRSGGGPGSILEDTCGSVNRISNANILLILFG